MSGDDHAAPNADASSESGDRSQPGGLHRWMKALFDLTPWGLQRRIEARADEFAQSSAQLEARLDARVGGVDQRLDMVEEGIRVVQSELAALGETRVAATEVRLDAAEAFAAASESRQHRSETRQSRSEVRQDAAEKSLAALTAETARLRDRVVPAVVGRSDALLERLVGELEELGSLVERMLLGEPLPVPGTSGIDEKRLAEALADVQPALLEAFRGSGAEIRHRLDRYLEALREAAPVLDLGCGRGELLLMLRESGIEAAGVEGDPALAQAAHRRALEVLEGDVLDVLRGLPETSRGAVTAIHLLEHLDAGRLLAVLAEIRRVLRPGGVLIAESPNPHSLRVGAALYWADPTHRRPLLPETLELYLTTSGFEIESRELLHPFPPEQLFAASALDADPGGDPKLAELSDRVEGLCLRLDELVNGPRDFVVWARKPL